MGGRQSRAAPDIRSSSAGAGGRRDHRPATVMPEMMCQIPHHAATRAIPPSPSKKAKISARERAEFWIPTSMEIARRSRSGSRNAAAAAYPDDRATALCSRTATATNPMYSTKFCRFAANATPTKITKKARDAIRIGLCSRSANAGHFARTVIPRATGTARSRPMVSTSSTGSSRTDLIRASVSSLSDPQKAKFSGVSTTARIVETPVMPIDSMVLPRARWVMKLEMFPPRGRADEDHPERDRRGRVQDPGEPERERREQEELSEQADRHGLGCTGQTAQLADPHVEGDAEHDEPEDDVEQHHGARVEVEAQVVDRRARGEESGDAYRRRRHEPGSWCIFLKVRNPGAHRCSTRSTSTCTTAGPPVARHRRSAGPSSCGVLTRSPWAPMDRARSS